MGSLDKKKNYKKIAKEVIDLEIKALKKLKTSINSSFNEAIEAITNCQSKVILCGVGKSGLIAAKISATLSSVGTPSFCVSANDCLHGDLGSISKKDVLILISNSGKTEELKPIIHYANRNKIKLIGIVSKKNSILYKASDIKLLIPEVNEAGLSIVPTSSTIAQLALGDSISIATLNKKKFTTFYNKENKIRRRELLENQKNLIQQEFVGRCYEDELYRYNLKNLYYDKLLGNFLLQYQQVDFF